MKSLQELQTEYTQDPAFTHLAETSNYVPGKGSLTPKVMLVGEAPGSLENAKRIPFVGSAGRLLHEWLPLAGLTEENAYITNAVKFMPYNEFTKQIRTPTRKELSASYLYLLEEHKLVGLPPVIIAIGKAAYFCLTGETIAILKEAGTFRKLDQFILIPMIHPAYVLRNEDYRRRCETQWRSLGQYFNDL